MQRNLLIEAKKYIQSDRRHRAWQKVVRVMAGCVVFCTTYALILPAITMEQDAFCGYEEHTHSEDCYVRTSPSLKLTCSPDELELHVHSEGCLDADGNTVCGLADYVAHTHTSDCFDENGLVVCAFPEIGQHVHDSGCYSVPETTAQSHTHSDSCYNKEKGELICTTVQQEAHTHTEACYAAEKALVCATAESAGHVHSDSCYTAENVLTCTTAESAGHTHADECYDAEGTLVCTADESVGHTHGEGCYTAQQNLTCGQAEEEAHTHGDSCYETPIICGLIETEGHTHTDACYTWNETVICGLEETPIPEPELICTAPIAEAHVHSADCFETTEEPLTCQLEESEEHTHTALCYGTWELACPMEEHTHELTCFSDPEADLETAQVWEKTFKDVELTGVWADDVLAIAKTQLGYTESTRNYEVWEDGTTHGYTRYGDWFGSPYGDWCAMFVSFCIHYAEIDGVPLNWGCRTWIEELSKGGLDLYREAGEYDPKPGDIIFFDWEDENGDSDDLADHVGLVAELIPATGTEPAKIKTIEGNSSNQVKYNKYDADDTEILGYGIMPENPELKAEEETETVTALYTYSDDAVYVEVQLPEDTTVPADAVLKVTPIESTDDGYSTYVAQAEEAVEGFVSNIALYDISFYTADGTYYPVDDTAKVTMGFVESPVDTTANVQVLHFAEEDAVPEVIKNVTVEEKEIEMTLDGIQKADIPAAAALEQQSQMSLFSRAMPAAPAETEPEVQTLTETRTVVEFETPGFSTFAVVEVESGTYTTTILDQAAIGGDLDGRTFMITIDYGNQVYALSSNPVVVHIQWNTGLVEYERLKAVAVTRDATTVTSVADDSLLWEFVYQRNITDDNGNVTGKVYYIRSVATGEYLLLGNNRLVTTTNSPNEIVIAYKDPNMVTLKGTEFLNMADNEGTQEAVVVFCTWGQDNYNDNMLLSEYKDEVVTNAIPVTGLAGKDYVIAGVDLGAVGDPPVMTAEWMNNTIPDGENIWKTGFDGRNDYVASDYGNVNGENAYADNKIVSITVPVGDEEEKKDDATTAVWRFEAAPDGKYYIKSLKTGTYLNIAANYLSLGEKQAIEVLVHNNNDGVARYVLRVPTGVENQYCYVNLCQNRTDCDFTGMNVNENGYGDDGNHLALVEVNSVRTDLGGKRFVISAVNNAGDGATLSALTSENTVYDGNNTTPELKGKVVTPSYNEAGDTVISISAESGNEIIWEFEDVDAANGKYRVKSVATGQYLQINDNGLTTVEDANAVNTTITVEQVAEPGDGVKVSNGVVCLVAESGQRVNLRANTIGFNFTFWGGGTDVTSNHLVLTEYDITGELVTDLDGRIAMIVAVNNGGNGTTYPALSSTSTTESVDGKAGLNSPDLTLNEDGTANIGNATDIAWQFEAVPGQPGYYHIKNANYYPLEGDNKNGTAGQYLNITKDGISLSDEPKPIQVVVANTTKQPTTKDVICLRVPAGDGKNYLNVNLYRNNSDNDFTTWENENALGDGGNHFVLEDITDEVVLDIREKIDALPTDYDIFNAVANNQSSYEEKIKYRDDMREIAVELWETYFGPDATKTLTDLQKNFIGKDRIDKLMELSEWLTQTVNVVENNVTLNATVKVFNYTADVNNEGLAADSFKFFSVHANEASVDGHADGDNVLNVPTMSPLLGADGYPYITNGTGGSLDYLFSGDKYTKGVMTDGGGLFQQDANGYYYYYSDENAAYYDPETNQFVLYDTVIRPDYTGTNNADPGVRSDEMSNFLPFNNPVDNVIFDPASAGPVISSVDGQDTQSAYLNTPVDLWFGMSVEFDFFMPKGGQVGNQDMVFDFHGDDDVWVYIDGVLILDIGGTHAAQDADINFETGIIHSQQTGETTLKAQFIKAANASDNDNITYDEATNTVNINGKTIAFNGDTLADYTAHDLKFFYMERGGTISYAGLKFNMPALPPNSLMVNKVATAEQDQNKDFQFRVVKADSDELFISAGTEYTIMQNGVEVDTGTVGEGGIFTLKSGQSAVFSNILDPFKNANVNVPNLVVQEILPAGETYEVSYQVSSVGTIVPVYNDSDGGDSTDSSFSSSAIDPTANEHEFVTFYNAPQGSGTLSITKQMAKGHESNETFYVRVRMGQTKADTLIPKGTQYHIGDATETVSEPGLIPMKAGQTVTILGITPGLYYEVAEFLTGNQNYKPTYTVEEKINVGTQARGNASISGVIDAGETVEITIENDPYDDFVNLPITKDVMPAGTADNFYFLVDQVVSQTNHNTIQQYRPGTLVRVEANGKSDANILLGVDGTGPWYFKVYEENTTSDYYYDPTFYIVEVTGGDNPQINRVWKNGTEQITITGNRMPFVNRKFTELTVTKTVVGGTGGTFNFNVNVTVGEGIVYLNDSVYLPNNGSKTYQIPYGANAEVTETNSDGYKTTYEVYSRYEAEDGELSNGAYAYTASNTSGGRAVQNIVPDNGNDSVKLFANMPSSGDYSMRLRYNTGIDRSFRIVANNNTVNVPCAGRGNWHVDWYYVDSTIHLNEGTNMIGIRATDGSIDDTYAYAPNLDYVDIILKGETAGITATQNGVTDPVTIHFTNTVGYELPMTGGTGTYWYTLGGLLLTMAAILMYNLINKRRKEELASS